MQSWEPNGCWFNSQAGHMPGLQGTREATTHWCFSPSLSPSLTLSLKINKIFKKYDLPSNTPHTTDSVEKKCVKLEWADFGWDLKCSLGLFECSYCSCFSARCAIFPHCRISTSLSTPDTDGIWFTWRPCGMMDDYGPGKPQSRAAKTSGSYWHFQNQWPGQTLLIDCRFSPSGAWFSCRIPRQHQPVKLIPKKKKKIQFATVTNLSTFSQTEVTSLP